MSVNRPEAVAGRTIETAIGPLRLTASGQGLREVAFDAGSDKQGSELDSDEPSIAVLNETERQLREYFQGRRHLFTLPLDLQGTDFQRRIWKAIFRIPFGATRSYAAIAAAADAPRAVRAASAACGANPIAIVVPCHRVVASDGRLHGYGGGLDLKRRLLELEGALSRPLAGLRV